MSYSGAASRVFISLNVHIFHFIRINLVIRSSESLFFHQPIDTEVSWETPRLNVNLPLRNELVFNTFFLGLLDLSKVTQEIWKRLEMGDIRFNAKYEKRYLNNIPYVLSAGIQQLDSVRVITNNITVCFQFTVLNYTVIFTRKSFSWTEPKRRIILGVGNMIACIEQTIIENWSTKIATGYFEVVGKKMTAAWPKTKRRFEA